MIGHHSLYFKRQILQHVWSPRRENFDNVAVHWGVHVTVHDFIVINEYAMNSVPIHL